MLIANCYLLLRPLRSVLGAALLTASDAGSIQRAPNHVITHAGQVLHTATADQNNRVLLQVVSDAGNIRGYFNAIRQTNAGDFAQGRIRLLGRLGINAGTHAAALRTSLQSRTGRLIVWRLPAFTNQLIECRHNSFCFPYRPRSFAAPP